MEGKRGGGKVEVIVLEFFRKVNFAMCADIFMAMQGSRVNAEQKDYFRKREN